MAKVSVRTLESAKPRAKHYRITVDRGLYLRVSKEGVKTWEVRFVVGPKKLQARLPKPFGYGEGYCSLVEAVEESNRIHALARQGIDYREHDKRQKMASEAVILKERLTLTEMFKAWILNGVARKDGNADLCRRFEKDVEPFLGHKPVKDITADDFRSVLRNIAARGVYRTTVIQLKDLRQMFHWAEKEQPWRRLLVEGDPTENINIKTLVPRDYDFENIRSRTLNPKEIRELATIYATTTEEYEKAPNRARAKRPLLRKHQLALWICLACTTRIGETSMAKWSNIDFDRREWFIPEDDVKGPHGKKQSQLIFLSDFALGLFLELYELTGHQEYCFPALRGEGTHMEVRTVAKQVADRQVMFKKRKEQSRRRHDNTLVLAGGLNGDWQPNDFRRTSATLMQLLGVAPAVIDHCQNHRLPGSKVRRSYLHYKYAKEKREAWQRVGNWVEQILGIKEVPGWDWTAVVDKAYEAWMEGLRSGLLNPNAGSDEDQFMASAEHELDGGLEIGTSQDQPELA